MISSFFLLPAFFWHAASHPHYVPRENKETGKPTTLAGSLCASPSCTVTPTSLSSLVFTASPVTVKPPGAESSIIVSFDPVTTKSFQPETTVLANTDTKGTLTLGKATVTGLKATATATYNLSPTETSQVVIVAEVEATTQLYFGTSDDDGAGGSCPIDGPFSSKERRDLNFHRSLSKRSVRIVDVDDGLGVNRAALLQSMIDEATTVLHAVDARLDSFNGNYDGITDVGFTRWFPNTQFKRLHNMVKAELRALTTADTNDPQNILTTWTTLESRPDTRDRTCRSENGAEGIQAQTSASQLSLRPHPGQPNGETCPGSWVIICPKIIKNYQSLALPKDFCTKKTLTRKTFNKKLLNDAEYNFDIGIGSGARVVIHELTHFVDVCAAVEDWDLGGAANKPPSCNVQGDYTEEVYKYNELQQLRECYENDPTAQCNGKPGDMALFNAENYTLAIIEWYIRSLCSGWNTPKE
ncbi:uncharacterized protein BDZ99DRAFT_539760 [Mytilinidion resinicola]|uniref:Lysine-specific metallo-endopeptidase domain-containing protein n=1 Tax=Mytilinidion resinicola TaxID=574789 RepID=A0A6A6YBP6_9PEZI|nr:uncharacterized protein BDZ99DRAFT_539760 [Mytilinidion resinicola]KAF2805434.1 hypothetical protein BDZ99DRAFT_539760 [Mytilinidion resinicola]